MNENAAFFVQQARAAGREPDPQDINPLTGKARSPFDGINDTVMARNRRISRSPNGGMTMGPNPQRKILAVDPQQKAEEDYSFNHRGDAAFNAMRRARQKDPNRPHETDDQFAANNDAETPGVPQVRQQPLQRRTPPGTVAVAPGGQDRIPTGGPPAPNGPGPAIIRYQPPAKPADTLPTGPPQGSPITLVPKATAPLNPKKKKQDDEEDPDETEVPDKPEADDNDSDL